MSACLGECVSVWMSCVCLSVSVWLSVSLWMSMCVFHSPSPSSCCVFHSPSPSSCCVFHSPSPSPCCVFHSPSPSPCCSSLQTTLTDIPSNNATSSGQFEYYWAKFNVVFMFFLVACFGIATSVLLFFHVYLVCSNKTTIGRFNL